MQSSNKKKKLWIEEKERLLKMTLEERRKEYKDYVSLDKIPSLKEELKSKTSNNDENPEEMRVKSSLCEKVSLYKGDITQLEVDAIVNAANSSLLGGGGVDGCIHRASGPCLFAECRTLHGCRTGEAKITCGYELPAKYVIHTVGPIARGQLNETHKADLASCYQSSLKLAKEHQIRTIAFPCISTGIYGFPNEPAAVIALNKCKEWLKKNHDEMDRIIFCVFLDVDFKIYKKKLVDVFVKGDDTKDDGEEEDEDIKEGTEQMNEDTEGTTQKAQSPPIKKYKGKQPESLQDPPEDNQEEKDSVSAEEMKEEIQEADEKNQSFPPITPEKEIGLPPEKSTDGSKDMIEEEGEEGLAGQEMPDKKITEGIAEQDYSQETKVDNPTDITMDSQADSQEDEANADSTSCPPGDIVNDPVNTISMKEDNYDLCQETPTVGSDIDVEMSSQNVADPNGGTEEKQMKED